MTNIESQFVPNRNAFGFLRLCLAFGVLVSHSWVLGGFGVEPMWHFSQGKVTLGRFCVLCFFSISGFLVMRSLDKSSSVGHFVWRRAVRILPPYWVSLAVCIFFFAPLYCWQEGYPVGAMVADHADSLTGFFTDNFWLRIRRWDIPPLLGTVPRRGYVNLSLWTLIYEMQCYLVLAVIGSFALKCGRASIFLPFVFVVWLLGILHFNFAATVSWFEQWPPWLWDVEVGFLFPYFFFGALLFVFCAKIPCHWGICAFSVVMIVIGLRFNLMAFLGPPAVSYSVVWLAINLPHGLSWLDGRKDISYGFYIYAWPLQQALALGHVQRFGIYWYVFASASGAAIFAVLSRILVETPTLRLKSLRMSVFR